MSIVNYDYYTNDFFGEKITEDKFQKYSVRAEEIIDLYTHQKISLIGFENFDEKTQMNIKKAILRKKSPSCGYEEIYDGTFTNTLTKGNGITANLLIENDIEIETM